MKKEYFTVNGRKYRAPRIVAKLAPIVIVCGQMGLAMIMVIIMFIIAYGLK